MSITQIVLLILILLIIILIYRTKSTNGKIKKKLESVSGPPLKEKIDGIKCLVFHSFATSDDTEIERTSYTIKSPFIDMKIGELDVFFKDGNLDTYEASHMFFIAMASQKNSMESYRRMMLKSKHK
jgi:hypothetical protein